MITHFWQILRIIFAIFSLYLVGDVFYRWDGFRYYASFFDYLPSVSLITVQWTIMAALTALIVWMFLKAAEWLFLRFKLKITVAHIWIFIGTFVSLGVITWKIKRHIMRFGTTFQEKLIVIICLILVAVFLTWLFRSKAEKWINAFQSRVTPLVWIFGFWFVVSMSLMTYNMWGKQTGWRATSQKTSRSSITDVEKPNIILITFDALTARNMYSYGYHRQTTPFISEWAKGGILFKRLEAASNLTMPTTASLMTGKRLWTHQSYVNIEGASAPLKSDEENLASVLRDNGYYTMKFVANPMASELLGINSSFDVSSSYIEFYKPLSLSTKIEKWLFEVFGNKFRLYNWLIKSDFAFVWIISFITDDLTRTEVPPEIAFNRFLSIIDSHVPAPFFAWIHLLPPHTPYLPPEPFLGMFGDSQKAYDKKSLRGNLNFRRNRYDEFIRYCDKQFEHFIAQLTRMKKLENTVIILSSDHGESFEHRYQDHGGPHLYEQVTHIPLIIKDAGNTEGRIIPDLVEQIDIPVTIIDLAHISIPQWMEGRSVVPLMRGISLPSKPIFSMSLGSNPRGYKITKGTIAVWEGDYKIIYYLDEDKSLLFNLKNDPGELNNLFDEEPERGQRLLSLIQANLKKANKKITNGDL